MKRCGLYALGLFLALRVCAGEDRLDLSWKWHEGDTLRYRSSEVQSQRLTTEEGEVGVHQEQIVLITLDVLKILEGNRARVRNTYDSFYIDIKNSETRIQYDSALGRDQKSANHPLVRPFRQMVGQSFDMVINSAGVIGRIEGFAEILQSIMDGMQLDASSPAVQLFRQAFSEEAVRAQVEMLFRVVPPEPVRVGDTWNRSSETPVPGVGMSRTTMRYKLTDLKELRGETCARISVRSDVTLSLEGEDGERMEQPAGHLTGLLYFGVEKGRLVQLELGSRIEEALPDQPDPYGPSTGAPAKQVLSQRISYELIE